MKFPWEAEDFEALVKRTGADKPPIDPWEPAPPTELLVTFHADGANDDSRQRTQTYVMKVQK